MCIKSTACELKVLYFIKMMYVIGKSFVTLLMLYIVSKEVCGSDENLENIGGHCPSSEWYAWGDQCYLIVNLQRTWQEAQQYCEGLSTYEFDVNLVSIHSNEENDMVQDYAEVNGYAYVWIGLSTNDTGNTSFTQYNDTTAMYGILEPGYDNPWDADGIDTFYFGRSSDSQDCEELCGQNPSCDAYTWYGPHWDSVWVNACVGRSDKWDTLVTDLYASSGVRDLAVFSWTDGTDTDVEFWTPGHPIVTPDERCVEIVSSEWRTYDCYYRQTFVCKTDQVSNDTERTQPQYQIELEGSFESSTGGDFSQECKIQYTSSMNTKSQQMGVVVNSLIGSSLCSFINDDGLSVVSTSSPMLFNGHEGQTSPTFYLKLASHLTMNDIETCTGEITNFLLPHSNWGDQVLPSIPGCPDVDFYNDAFNHTQDRWICLDAKEKQDDRSLALLQLPPLNYGIGHVGQLHTETGEDLSIECLNAYSRSLYDKTNAMVNSINNPEDGAVVCAGDDFNLLVISAFLSAEGSQGISIQDYILNPSGDMQFIDVYNCADELSAYLSSHGNWIQPIIPQVPGCPKLVFDPEQFLERTQEWVCPQSKEEKAGNDINKLLNLKDIVMRDVRKLYNDVKEVSRKRTKLSPV